MLPTPALYATGDAELDVFSSILTSERILAHRDLVLEQKAAKDVAAFQMSMAPVVFMQFKLRHRLMFPLRRSQNLLAKA